VSFLVADDTKSYQIFSRVIAEAAPPLDVMDLKAFDLPARTIGNANRPARGLHDRAGDTPRVQALVGAASV
jgi:hypothetical protein